jgi:hypothetical protein
MRPQRCNRRARPRAQYSDSSRMTICGRTISCRSIS